MRSRLNFGLSLAIDFDCFLIDEVVAAGDARFQRRSREELFEKRSDRALILASHIPEIIMSHCSRAVVLHRGRAKVFDDLELAIAIYNDL
jgi:capsular polysaccharide transport system ATP-binding protein